MNPHLKPNPAANRARADLTMERAASEAVRGFIGSLRRDLIGLGTLTGSSLPEPQRMAAWWTDEVSTTIASAARDAWAAGFSATTDLAPSRSSLGRLDEIIVRLTDRLSRTISPTLPDQAWQRLQVALAEEMSVGSSLGQIRDRIGAEMRWDVDSRYWQARKTETARRLDALLDPYGPPGTAAREAARLNDPQVRELQRMNARFTRQLDSSRSWWERRATAIARTETTSIYESGTWDAATRSGATEKRWVATFDARTRDSHAEAHGQTRRIDEPYTVGGAALMTPGDWSGPAREIVHCRCTQVYGDTGGFVADDIFGF